MTVTTLDPPSDRPRASHARTAPSPHSRICTGCGHELPFRLFRRNRYSSTGYRARCKECERTASGQQARQPRFHVRPGWSRCPERSGCGRDLPDDMFPTKTNGTIATPCRDCRRVYQREYARIHRRLHPDRVAESRAAETQRRTKQRAADAKQRKRETADRQRWVRAKLGDLHAAGWRTADIAAAVGVSSVAVCNWRRGACVPRDGVVGKLRRLQ